MQLKPQGRRRAQRGLSIIELMVGFAVGLFIVGGAIKLFVDYVSSNRRLLLETRVNQDLRAGADLVVRDLRRSGYWQSAVSQFWVPTATGVGGSYTANQYRTVDLDGAVTGACPGAPTRQGSNIRFAYAKDADNAVSAPTEQRGYKAENNVLYAYNGAWQAVSDVNTLRVNMTVCEYTTQVPLYETCTCRVRGTCTAAQFQGGGPYAASAPRTTISQYIVTMNAQSQADASVVRSISESVRLVNDAPVGTCPDI
jgi:prepilin peptidase dependent protein B